LKSDKIGASVTIDAIVTKVSEVRPMIKLAMYACDICGYEAYQTVYDKQYLPLVDCPSQVCKNNQIHGKLYPQWRASKFVSYQEIKIQEPQDQVPIGHVPRTLTVCALNENVKQCSPGNSVKIHGILLAKSTPICLGKKQALIQDIYLEASKIIKSKETKKSDLSEEMIKKIGVQRNKTNDILSSLSQSIAPEIYGMDDIKKALLLQMVGGVSKEMPDGMKIRGNLNILLMGDPGVAKSQLLKYISHIAPRGVYTTGKGSSGVGLTAAVVKDPVTNDLVLEGGALVLADMGVCCIDEFDKMTDYDRANIHEVMEQQTVSIAKAGITARLNARSSVLAAANPTYGKYNRKLTPNQNINLPAALLSRFDLTFLLLDTPDEEMDQMLAKHILYVHQNNISPKLDFEPLPISFIREYVSHAKTYNPVIPKDLHNFIIQKYVEKRKEQVDVNKEGYEYITPRSLLAILRLSQALARLRCNDEVDQMDINKALEIIDSSRSSLNNDEEKKDYNYRKEKDLNSSIFTLLRESCSQKKSKTIKFTDLERIVLQKGYKLDNLQECIKAYTKIDVIYLNNSKTEITLL